MLESGEVTTSNGETISVGESTSTLNNLQVIRHFLRKHHPTRTLEVGLAFGASALTILYTQKETAASDFLHVAIDPFQESVYKNVTVDAIEADGLSGKFRLHVEPSYAVLPRLVAAGEGFGLIYIDGSHLFENAFVDFYYSALLLSTGGICLFDDCSDPHVKKVIRFITKNYSGYLRRLPLGGIIKKPFHKRLANRLGRFQLAAFEKIAQPPRKGNSKFVAF